MSKVYSNKALPPGTVLREWRLEDVLGVGGFGIVYKARGIYFDELVAIKEYFPSAISERQDDATIVPVDSDAEEVHALGLKKFVEEAKLLWNLSTPSRHPNIVSVRSLFEIHGSAYMVMDFEDGVSLSKLLKEGRRFNEASLTALIRPIAEGLERAHRVGVLHRDIKPPNILVVQDNRPVLIDFGSARFESGDATSTSVTFHTPPYAAIEQYVKTYEQGPWTDIYALGVVLYECVAGEKPAEVLERLHGNASKPLSEGDWPGFSKSFLAAVDAAMTIRPDERPRLISDWLALFDRPHGASEMPLARYDEEDDQTKIGSFAASSERIMPVAPPPPGFETEAQIETAVPDSPSEAEFTLAGMNTRSKRPLDRPPNAAARGSGSAPQVSPEFAAPASLKVGSKAPGTAAKPKAGRSAIYAGIAVGAVLVGGGSWYLLSGDALPSAVATSQDAAAGGNGLQPGDAAALSTGMATLAEEAKRANLPVSIAEPLSAAARQVAALEAGSEQADVNPASAQAEIGAIATQALLAFTKATVAHVETKARKASRDLPWSDARRSAAARGASAGQRQIAAALLQKRNAVEGAVAVIGGSSTGGDALAVARQALTDAQAYAATLAEAYRAGPAGTSFAPKADAAGEAKPPTVAAAQEQNASIRPADKPAPEEALSPATLKEFRSVVDKADDVARDVIGLGNRSRPGRNATEEQQEKFRIRQQNAQAAKNYQTYLDTLSRSMKGNGSEAEARESVANARQTLSYLTTMLVDSRASLK